MNLTLDAASEKRIQRELDRGHYTEASAVIAHALALLEDQEDWLLRDKDAINQRLDESHAQIHRGEGVPEQEVRKILAADRIRRVG